jgi:hypothetical protein
MDGEETGATLALLDGQIAHCERLIIVQQSRVAALAATSQDAADAKRILDALRNGLTGLRVHRRALVHRARGQMRH